MSPTNLSFLVPQVLYVTPIIRVLSIQYSMSNLFLFHGQKYFVIFGVIYVFIVLLLAAVPYFQSQYVAYLKLEVSTFNPLILVRYI